MNADAQIDGRAYLAPAIEANWEDLISRNREIAPFVLDFLNVHLITLHLEKSPPALIRFVEEALPVTLIDEWTGSNNAGEKTTIRLYRVDVSRSHEEWQLDLGSSLGRLFAAEGWSPGVQDQVRYATRREADLLLDLPTEGGRLTFQLYGPAELGRLLVNGVPLHWRVTAQVGEALVVEVQVPPTVANEPVDRLALRFNALYPLQELWRDQTTGWSIGTTGIVLPADRPLFVRSAGKDAGDVAQIFVAGRDVARNALGYNLAALTSEGQVLESVAFNTLISPAESVAMANWLAHWPAGTIIAGAVRDEASYNLGEDAVAALRRVGVDTDLRGRFRGSHAFIGVIGALPASAAESFAPFRQATATAGPSIDAEQVSGGIGRIEFSPLP
jgi:hypothetical protein